MVRKTVTSLGIVLALVALFAVCLVSANQLLQPHHMPFGVTEPSPAVDAIQAKDPGALDVIQYSSEADLLQAAAQGDIYGGYIPGPTTDTIVTVPAQSFFGEIYVRGAFAAVAKETGRATTTTVVAPLPTSDRTGGVVGLLMLPALMGGYLIASLLFTFTKRAAPGGRIAIIVGFSLVIALIIGAGAVVNGAVPLGDIWVLLPCFALLTSAVALSGAAIQHFARGMGTLLIALLYIILGGAGAGGGGRYLLPDFWQTVGALFPPRHAIELFRNVLYFGGHNIVTPIAVLSAYALIGAAVLYVIQSRNMAEESAAAASATEAEKPAAAAGATDASPSRSPLVPKNVVAPIGFAVLLTTLFAVNYMSSGHEPIASNMPFGLVGSSQLPEAAQGPLFSLDVITYQDETAATQAMDAGEIYGALIVSDTAGTPSQLTVVNSISDLSPLDIAANFEIAAKQSGETFTVKPYAPTPLAPNDPFALVSALVLVPLLVGGYMSTTLLTKALGATSGRWHGVWLVGFAVVAALVVDIIVTVGLKGFPSDAFWIIWPIMALIMMAVALFTAVLRRIVGPIGIFLAIIVVIQFGNPSSGGANGVPYLTAFWRDLGPFLPPRNAFLLLRNTVYFDGQGITQPLLVLLAYAVIAGLILIAFDWFIDRPPAAVPGIDEETDTTAVMAPVGPPP